MAGPSQLASSLRVYPVHAARQSEHCELAGRIGDEHTRKLIQNVTEVMQLNPQPLAPASLRAVLEAVALNPQPLPPAPDQAAPSSGR